MTTGHPKPLPQKTVRTPAETQAWLIDRLVEQLLIPRAEIGVDEPIVSFGIDSVRIISLTSNLEDWANVRFTDNPLEQHPTIEDLARYVAELTSR